MHVPIRLAALAVVGPLALGACGSSLVDSPEAQARDACNLEAYESTEYVNAAEGEREFARQAYVDDCMARKGF